VFDVLGMFDVLSVTLTRIAALSDLGPAGNRSATTPWRALRFTYAISIAD
jgi:hypothetical protein